MTTIEQALRMAVRQNEHDMLMTGEELRLCRAALAAHEAHEAQLTDDQIALLAFRMYVGGNIGIEEAWTDEQKENRAKIIAFARAIEAAVRGTK